MRTWTKILIVAFLALPLGGCRTQTNEVDPSANKGAADSKAKSPETVNTDGTQRESLDQSQTLATNAIQPHMVIHGEAIYVTFIHDGNVAVSCSKDGGVSFGQPVVAIDVQGHARGGAQRGPRIGVDAQGNLTVTAPVTFDDAEHAKQYPTADLFFARSTDGAQTWTEPMQVNEISKKAPEALHWMTVAPDGEAHVAWLDLREREGPGQDIFYATIKDGVVGKNGKVASTVCECCAPGLAVDPSGGALIAFREGGAKSSREIFARRIFAPDAGLGDIVQVNQFKTLEGG